MLKLIKGCLVISGALGWTFRLLEELQSTAAAMLKQRWTIYRRTQYHQPIYVILIKDNTKFASVISVGDDRHRTEKQKCHSMLTAMDS